MQIIDHWCNGHSKAYRDLGGITVAVERDRQSLRATNKRVSRGLELFFFSQTKFQAHGTRTRKETNKGESGVVSKAWLLELRKVQRRHASLFWRCDSKKKRIFLSSLPCKPGDYYFYAFKSFVSGQFSLASSNAARDGDGRQRLLSVNEM